MIRNLLMAATALALGGCAMTHPQTAEEFRQAVPGAASGKIEVHEVKRPLAAVAESFRKKAPECLGVAIRTIQHNPRMGPSYTTTYRPTLVVGSERVELHVQQHIDNAVKISKEPAGGYFLLVVDAEPVDRKNTRLTIYRPAWAYGVLVDAVKNWAGGDNMGCPDLTRIEGK